MNKDKQNVLEHTCALFAKYGIRAVSMDMISGSLKVSKKTLYELFDDKKDILNKCVHSEMLRLTAFTRQMGEQAGSELETLIMQTVIFYNYISSFCPAYFKDLDKYTSACEILDRYGRSIVSEHRQILNRGIEQGYFLPDTNADIILKMLGDQVTQSKDTCNEDRLSSGDFLYLLATVLKGVCTEKGIMELEAIKEKWMNSGMPEKLVIRKNGNE